MYSAAGFSRRDPLDTVDSAFKFHLAVNVATGKGEGYIFHTAEVGFCLFEDFRLPPLRFGKVQICTEQFPGKECRLITARRRFYSDDDIFCIVGIRRQQRKSPGFAMTVRRYSTA